MNDHAPIKESKYIHWVIIFSTLLVLFSAIAVMTFHLRKLIRHQIVLQDGYVLHAAAIVQQFTQDALAERSDLSQGPEETLGVLLDASKLRDVIAVRIFDRRGQELLRFPENVASAEIPESDLLTLAAMQPVSRFGAETPISTIFSGGLPFETDEKLPILKAYIPLQANGQFNGAAELIVNGENVAVAFAALDHDLLLYAGLIGGVGGVLVMATLVWAFGRLHRANSLLVERTRRLLKANHELTMAAKTSAIGAVTAHLIHDLKSPLFGLELFVTSRKEHDKSGEDWDTALDTTRRMQKVISDVVQILQEEKGTAKYELTASELISLLHSKLSNHAGEKGIKLEAVSSSEARFSNKDANLILLILTNLGHNAIQATPSPGAVRLCCFEQPEHITFEVQDTGPGIPEEAQNALFTPGRTTKKGGTGLGLPISKQLAYHLQGELTLKGSSPSGTTFELKISREILVQTPASDQELAVV